LQTFLQTPEDLNAVGVLVSAGKLYTSAFARAMEPFLTLKQPTTFQQVSMLPVRLQEQLN